VGFEFLERARKTSILTCMVLLPVIAHYVSLWSAGAFATGCVWSLVNLHVMRLLIGAVVEDPGRHKKRVAVIALIKVPVLYALGFVALRIGVLPVVALLAGFLWPLFVVTLKAMGRMLLRLDNRRSLARPPSQ